MAEARDTYGRYFGRDIVRALIPHRDPMLFTDRVLRWDATSITTEFDVRPDLPCFAGHFPGKPVFPGVLMIEAVAQAGALLGALTLGLEDDSFIAFSGVSKAKFPRPVTPGDTLTIDVSIERTRLPFVWFAGTAAVAGRRVASLGFSAAKTTYAAVSA